MMKVKRPVLWISLAALAAMGGCGGGGGGGGGPTDNPPTVSSVGVAGSSATGVNTLTMTLAATASDDGGITGYAWTASPSAGLAFSDPTAAAPTVTITAAGTYTITLTVSDQGGQTATGSVTVSVGTTPLNPIAITFVNLDVTSDKDAAFAVRGSPAEVTVSSAGPGAATTLQIQRPTAFSAGQTQRAVLDATSTAGGLVGALTVDVTYQ